MHPVNNLQSPLEHDREERFTPPIAGYVKIQEHATGHELVTEGTPSRRCADAVSQGTASQRCAQLGLPPAAWRQSEGPWPLPEPGTPSSSASWSPHPGPACHSPLSAPKQGPQVLPDSFLCETLFLHVALHCGVLNYRTSPGASPLLKAAGHSFACCLPPSQSLSEKCPLLTAMGS